jgi:hypothetical protein
MLNMQMPDYDTRMRNPYLNRIPEVEPDLDLHTLELLNLSQITEETQRKFKVESDIVKKAERDMGLIERAKRDRLKKLREQFHIKYNPNPN